MRRKKDTMNIQKSEKAAFAGWSIRSCFPYRLSASFDNDFGGIRKRVHDSDGALRGHSPHL